MAAFLGRVAEEMDLLLRELTTARTENRWIRDGLRQWQSRHVGCRFVDPEWPRHNGDQSSDPATGRGTGHDSGRGTDRGTDQQRGDQRDVAQRDDEPNGRRRNGGHW